MPCRTDDSYGPSAREIEKGKVLDHLNYVATCYPLPSYAKQLGHVSQLDVDNLTAMLCAALELMSEQDLDLVVYDARNPKSRALADWWEAHQKMDAERTAREAEKQARTALREVALAKLTREEKKALGLERERP